MRSWLLVVLGIFISGLVVSAVMYSRNILPSSPVGVTLAQNTVPQNGASVLPSPASSASPNVFLPVAENPNPAVSVSISAPDLTPDSNGLSKVTVILNTTQGAIKFKFYPNDAPKTVKRIAELIGKGFYNGLSFHRVIPGFVIQGGDPTGTGAGGSGQKLDAEFNNRKHVEGTVAMARSPDVNSADSQFYISLGVLPHLDHNYTVFGQVIEGIDVAKKIKVGDKMTSVSFQ